MATTPSAPEPDSAARPSRRRRSLLWLAIGGGVWGVRALRRATGRSERIVLREVIQPGERIVITQVPRKVPRKQRRAAAKAG